MDGLICAGFLRYVPDQSPSSFPLWYAVVKIILVMQSHGIAYHAFEVIFTPMIRGHESAVLK